MPDSAAVSQRTRRAGGRSQQDEEGRRPFAAGMKSAAILSLKTEKIDIYDLRARMRPGLGGEKRRKARAGRDSVTTERWEDGGVIQKQTFVFIEFFFMYLDTSAC